MSKGAADEPQAIRTEAHQAVRRAIDAGRRIPGLGHPIHTLSDPRTELLYELAESTGDAGPHLRLLSVVADAFAEISGKRLPINGAGAAGQSWLI